MGSIAIVLHGHLPFVRHPEQPFYWEEQWLFEAIAGCYLPLLDALNRVKSEHVPYRLTLSLTPPLIYMLRDSLLRRRFENYLDQRIELASRECQRTRYVPAMHQLAQHYKEVFTRCRHDYIQIYARDVVGAFAALQRSGHVEIIASCATHGFLPYLQVNPTSVRAQVELGVEVYRRTFGCSPRGFWLPECGYNPGLEQTLADSGIDYFIVDTHGITHASPPARFGPYQNVRCANGVGVFGRDPESSHQVWSAQCGYPCASVYREFHRDLGYDAEYDYIRPFIDPAGSRIPTGFKYYRITGPSENKAAYHVATARAVAIEHARDFVTRKKHQIERLRASGNNAPIVVAPFDAELFGHWWYEGPIWLEQVLRSIAAEPGLNTESLCRRHDQAGPIIEPSASTWGHQGHGRYWLNSSNDWIYPRLHAAGARMADLVRETPPADLTEAYDQAARELLLAESSDWTFMMSAGQVASYARKRIDDHLDRFERICHGISQNNIDSKWFSDVRERDTLFDDIACSRFYQAKRMRIN